jgi:hypothetical protein
MIVKFLSGNLMGGDFGKHTLGWDDNIKIPEDV